MSVDRDIVDEDIRIMKNYTKQLIEDDPAVFKMIEQYIKKRESLQEHEEDIQKAEDGIYEITDEDMKEYTDFVNSSFDDKKEGE